MFNISTTPGIDYSQLRSLAKAQPENFVRKLNEAVENGDLGFATISGKKPKYVISDIRELFRAFYDVKVPIQIPDMAGETRSITTSAFPVITGTTAIAAINAAYDALPTIGDQLVTEIDDNKKVTTMAQINALDNNVDEVKELDDFPEVGASEEYIEIRHKKNGRKLTISAEMIQENNVVGIVDRLNALGEIVAEWIEEQTLYRVTDHYGSAATPAEPYVYRPNGSGTQLYNSTANNPGTRAPSGTRVTSNALADESDIGNARVVLAAMQNPRGKRMAIPYSEMVILVPDALLVTCLKIFNSEYVPGVENEINIYGPRGKFAKSAGQIISSPKLDDLSSSAWYMGAFKRQFLRKWKMRFEYVTLGMDTQAYLNSQVAFQARIAYDCEIGARDYVFCVQNLTSTTAPADE